MLPSAGAHFFHRTRRGVVNSLNIFSGDLLPLFWLKNTERERINFPGRSADAVSVVFDNEQHRQFSLFGEANRFEKIALAGGGIANRRDNDILFAIEFEAPGDSACGQELRAS